MHGKLGLEVCLYTGLLLLECGSLVLGPLSSWKSCLARRPPFRRQEPSEWQEPSVGKEEPYTHLSPRSVASWCGDLGQVPSPWFRPLHCRSMKLELRRGLC